MQLPVTTPRCAEGPYSGRVPDAAPAITAILLVLAGGGLATVAVLGLSGRLTRNRWAGVRTRATMASPEAFALGNRVAAPPLLAGALLVLLAGVAGLALSGPARPVAMLLCLAGTGALVVAGGTLGNRAAVRVRCAPQRCAECTGCELMDTLAADQPAH